MRCVFAQPTSELTAHNRTLTDGQLAALAGEEA